MRAAPRQKLDPKWKLQESPLTQHFCLSFCSFVSGGLVVPCYCTRTLAPFFPAVLPGGRLRGRLTVFNLPPFTNRLATGLSYRGFFTQDGLPLFVRSWSSPKPPFPYFSHRSAFGYFMTKMLGSLVVFLKMSRLRPLAGIERQYLHVVGLLRPAWFSPVVFIFPSLLSRPRCR